MNTMPVAYLDAMILEFSDGRVWEIDVKEHLQSDDPDSVAKKMLQTMNEYKDTIKKVDFKINVDLLKKEIKDRTDQILQFLTPRELVEILTLFFYLVFP